MTEPLRVAYLSRYLPSPSETFVLDEAVALEAAGAQVRSFAVDRAPRGPAHARFAELYGRTAYLPRAGHPAAILASLMLEGHPLMAVARTHWGSVARPRDLRRACWLARRLVSERIQVIRVHHAAEVSRYAAVAGLLSGIPVSVAVHARDLFVPADDFAWILGQCAHVTTITPFHRERLLRLGLPSERVMLLPCAVAVPATRALPPAPHGPLRVLSVGRLVPKKGHDVLIEALSLLARVEVRVECVIVGAGTEGLALRRLAAQHMARASGRLSIEFRGDEPHERVTELLMRGRFHAFVLPCRVAPDGDRDGLPVSLLEAQAAGLPTVTTALAGFESQFQDGRDGVLLALGAEGRRSLDPRAIDPADLAQVLHELYEDLGWRADLANGARAAAEGRDTPDELGRRLRAALVRLESTR